MSMSDEFNYIVYAFLVAFVILSIVISMRRAKLASYVKELEDAAAYASNELAANKQEIGQLKSQRDATRESFDRGLHLKNEVVGVLDNLRGWLDKYFSSPQINPRERANTRTEIKVQVEKLYRLYEMPFTPWTVPSKPEPPAPEGQTSPPADSPPRSAE